VSNNKRLEKLYAGGKEKQKKQDELRDKLMKE
jgi:hypothetical protein